MNQRNFRTNNFFAIKFLQAKVWLKKICWPKKFLSKICLIFFSLTKNMFVPNICAKTFLAKIFWQTFFREFVFNSIFCCKTFFWTISFHLKSWFSKNFDLNFFNQICFYQKTKGLLANNFLDQFSLTKIGVWPQNKFNRFCLHWLTWTGTGN